MIQAICWVLIHSLWQGLLLALAGGGIILSTKRTAAAVRYRMLCGLLGIFLGGVGLTFFYEWTMVKGGGDVGTGVGLSMKLSMDWLGDWCSVHAFPIVLLWLIVTIVKSILMATGWGYMRQMRQEGMTASALWVERVDELSRQLGIRGKVRLVESALARVPMVIGQLRPIIYIPLGLINHLPASEMEAVLLHELAHIRRYDHVVNMVQQVAECLLFFNPGFLWISSLLREERENCCDDIAITHTRDRVEFVRALVRFKEHSLRGIALGFPGDKRQLLNRVVRISRQENKTLSKRERLVLLGGGLALMCLVAAGAGKTDVKRTDEQIGRKDEQVRSVGARPVKVAPAELVSVLQAREQVAQNMEWVKAELDRLHHQSGRKKRNGAVRHVEQPAPIAEQPQVSADQEVVNEVQGERSREQGELDRSHEQEELNRQQAERNRQQGLQNLEQALRDQQQVQRNQEQAAKDREQAAKDRAQADRDRHQSELDRIQAERDRQQAEQIRVEAELNRARAERDRDQVELNRQQAERDRAQADRGKQERGRAQELQKRLQADRDKEQAVLGRQQARREGQ